MLFLDTEFHQNARGFGLLSIGIVGPTNEFYAELDGPGLDRIRGLRKSSFMRSEVLSQFGRIAEAQSSQLEMATRTAQWLNALGLGEVVEMAYDYSVDYSLLENLLELASVPMRVKLEPVHLGYLLEDADGLAAADAAWAAMMTGAGVGRHHALADAIALRARFEAVHPPASGFLGRAPAVL